MLIFELDCFIITNVEISREAYMENGNVDRRVRKTRAMLRQCLGQLLKKKKIQEISVKEISEMADINRGTFYLHYRDVYDLLSYIENEMFTEFNEILDRHKISELEVHPKALITEIFVFVKNNSDMAQILMGQNGDIRFLNQLKEVFREKIMKPWAARMRKQQMKEFESFYSFIIGGCIGMLDNWFENNLDQSPEELADHAEKFILNGLSSIQGKDNTAQG
jgi:AcrR family transcriptional regulator